jgi:hypothetical protein
MRRGGRLVQDGRMSLWWRFVCGKAKQMGLFPSLPQLSPPRYDTGDGARTTKSVDRSSCGVCGWLLKSLDHRRLTTPDLKKTTRAG